jgi:hypothetical protein
MEMFEQEVKTFKRMETALRAAPGRFVVIKGEDVVGCYDTYRDALQVGYDKFGLDGFFLKELGVAEPVLWRAAGELTLCR